MQLFTPLYSHCSRGEREGSRMLQTSGAVVRQTSPPHTNGEIQNLCSAQASEAQNTLLTCIATHYALSMAPRHQLQQQARRAEIPG